MQRLSLQFTKKPLITLVTLLLFFWLILSQSSFAAQNEQPIISDLPELSFASIAHLAEQEVGRIVLPQIYQTIGIKVHITPLPANRAMLATSSGSYAGEIMRITSYAEISPELIRVPTPYYQLQTAAFALSSKNITLNNAYDLKDYRVGKVSGVAHTNEITHGLIKVYNSPSTEQLFAQLRDGRIDIALTNLADGNLLVSQNSFTDIVVINSSLAIHDLHHYLHKDHQSLVPLIDDKIKQLKANGQLAELIQQAEHVIYAN